MGAYIYIRTYIFVPIDRDTVWHMRWLHGFNIDMERGDPNINEYSTQIYTRFWRFQAYNMLRSQRWSNHCDNACWFPFFWTNHKTGQWCSQKQMFCIALLFRLRFFSLSFGFVFLFVGDSNLVSSFVFRYFIGRFSLCRSFNICDGYNGEHDVCNGSLSSYKL